VSGVSAERADTPVTDQTFGNRTRETLKLSLRRVLRRADLDLTRGAYANRVAATLRACDIDALLDVGANVGQYAVMTRQAGFAGRMVSCEPLSGAFAELSRRAARDAGWTVVRSAVGRHVGETTINMAANSFSSSVLPMAQTHVVSAPGSGYVGAETVPMTTIQDLVVEHGLEPARTLLKIDTQGYEGEVLAGAGDLVTEFGALQLELSFVELYVGQPLFDELYQRVRDWGYRLQSIEPGFSDANGRLMQCDGLFVRSS